MPGFPGKYQPWQPPASDGAGGWKPGAVITPTIYTGPMVIGAVTTAPTKGACATDMVSLRRIGDCGEFEYEIDQTGTGTAGSGDYLISLPIGLSWHKRVTLVTTAENIATKLALGSGGISNGAARGLASVVPYDATRFRVLCQSAFSGHAFFGTAIYSMNAAVGFRVRFTAQIAGWDFGQ